MQGIGAVLRREREKRNLTLDDVAEKTKIRTKYLEAIENEKFEVLPGAVYVKGFISSYIKCLGIADLPEVQNIMQADTTVQEVKEEEKVSVTAKERNKPQKIEEEPLNKKSSVIILLSVLAVCALLLVQWLYNGGLQNDIQEEVPPQVEQAPEENIPEEPVEPVEPEPVYEGLVMELTIIDLTAGVEDKCWLEAKGDGVQILNATLLEGQSVKLEAKENLKLHLGNAGVVQITLNGQDLGRIGEKGKVVTREFTLNDVAQ